MTTLLVVGLFGLALAGSTMSIPWSLAVGIPALGCLAAAAIWDHHT